MFNIYISIIKVGVAKLIIGVFYFVMMLFTIRWVKMNENEVRGEGRRGSAGVEHTDTALRGLPHCSRYMRIFMSW